MKTIETLLVNLIEELEKQGYSLNDPKNVGDINCISVWVNNYPGHKLSIQNICGDWEINCGEYYPKLEVKAK